MFQMIRKYATFIIIITMSMFVLALIVDEYSDSRRALDDLRIESCVELETEDYEWGDSDEDNMMQGVSNLISLMPNYCPSHNFSFRYSAIHQSDKQKLGLVRRYAPNDNFVSYNYILT